MTREEAKKEILDVFRLKCYEDYNTQPISLHELSVFIKDKKEGSPLCNYTKKQLESLCGELEKEGHLKSNLRLGFGGDKHYSYIK